MVPGLDVGVFLAGWFVAVGLVVVAWSAYERFERRADRRAREIVEGR